MALSPESGCHCYRTAMHTDSLVLGIKNWIDGLRATMVDGDQASCFLCLGHSLGGPSRAQSQPHLVYPSDAGVTLEDVTWPGAHLGSAPTWDPEDRGSVPSTMG